MSREHVFGQWVSRTGLDLTPVQHHAGPLNRVPRDMGEQPPFRQTVKDVCASCNNGWMSRLEDVAQRVLPPLIRGESGSIAVEDQAAIAAWVQKTGLTAMLLSSEEQRARGYGLSPREYRALYEHRDRMRPLDESQVWVGNLEASATFSAVQVTPLCVRIPDALEPELPQGYVVTIALGALILHGLRFTTPTLAIEMSADLGMPRIWPSAAPATWPFGRTCSQSSFRHLAAGGLLTSSIEHVSLEPWSHAAQLPQSAIREGAVEVPAPCGQHAIRYPTALLREALFGRFYAFPVACECHAYLIHTTSESVRFKAGGEWEGITAMYQDLVGDEVLISDEIGDFVCKRLP